MVSTIEKTYTVTHKCGHEVSMPRQRQQKATIARNIAFHETRVCKVCFVSDKKSDSQKVLDAILKIVHLPTLTEGSEKQINWANSLRNQLIPNAIMSIIDKFTYVYEDGQLESFGIIKTFNKKFIQSIDAKDWINLLTGKHEQSDFYFPVKRYPTGSFTRYYSETFSKISYRFHDSEVSDSDKKKIQYYQPEKSIDEYVEILESFSNLNN
tara:strand:- start:39 stop:668 length:630 start_codon:yes stop_codon:yes gene_type:complete